MTGVKKMKNNKSMDLQKKNYLEIGLDSLRDFVNSKMNENNVTGMSISIVSDTDIILNDTFGVKNNNTKESIDRETTFEAASLSKPLFAYIFFKLMEEGIIDLDTPLYKYMPYKDIEEDENYMLITARMVLSHTTGFPNWRSKEQLTIDFSPGSKFSYSGEGFVFLQKVIEKITGKSLEDMAAEIVFKPLGMGHSSYVWNEKINNNIAIGHNENGQVQDKREFDQANSAYSLYSNSEDYAKFLIAVMNHTELSQDIFNEMMKIQIMIPNYEEQLSWGLSWGLQNIQDRSIAWHWGDNGGYKNYVFFDIVNKIGLVCFTNSDNGLFICNEIVKHVTGEEQIAFKWIFE